MLPSCSLDHAWPPPPPAAIYLPNVGEAQRKAEMSVSGLLSALKFRSRGGDDHWEKMIPINHAIPMCIWRTDWFFGISSLGLIRFN
jgi:hypothetical protein